MGYDPGCNTYADGGQRANCPKTCLTCPSLSLPPGEICGRFRILRGCNHCGIETLGSHPFVANYAPSAELLPSFSGQVGCKDDLQWNDGYGRGCLWYREKGDCRGIPDVGH